VYKVKNLFSDKLGFKDSSLLECDAASLGMIPSVLKEFVPFKVRNHLPSNAQSHPQEVTILDHTIRNTSKITNLVSSQQMCVLPNKIY
jgi:hypothetical protein